MAGSIEDEPGRGGGAARSRLPGPGVRPGADDRRAAVCGGFEALRESLARAHPRARLRCIETHRSRVLLVGDRVYKLRRLHAGPQGGEPALADRERVLRRELELNRRHSPPVYLGVQALGRHPGGRVELLEDGQRDRDLEVIDWVLVMRRLPRARMLDQAIHAGTVEPADIDRVAARLRAFHLEGRQAGLRADRLVARIGREQRRNGQTLADAARHLGAGRGPVRAIEQVLAQSDARWAEQRAACGARAAQGLIVEGHGDLRPEHVCLRAPIALIDGLEFSRSLRLLDPWEELCLLGLLCGVAGAAWIGPRLGCAYQACASGEITRPPAELLAFYTAHHALVRARLAFAHLLAPRARRRLHWQRQTRRYLACAQAACEGWSALGGAWASGAAALTSAVAR